MLDRFKKSMEIVEVQRQTMELAQSLITPSDYLEERLANTEKAY
jgi:hypothetical protein